MIISQEPFDVQIDEFEGETIFSIVVNCDSQYPNGAYYLLLSKYDLSGNGPCWENLITFYLEKEKPELLDELYFDSEAGACLMYFDSEESLQKFTEIVFPFFADFAALEKFIAEADREMIDD